MRPSFTVAECLKDSPKFRAEIELAEQNVANLEVKLDKVVKQCNAMIEAGKLYGSANSAFFSGVQELASHFTSDPVLEPAFEGYITILAELQKYHGVMLDLYSQSLPRELQSLMRSELKQVKDAQAKFRKASDDYESALNKHISIPKTKPSEFEEALQQMVTAKAKFSSTSLEYVDVLNVFSEKQRLDVLHSTYSYVNAQSTFFHQGSELFEENEMFLKDVANKLLVLTDLTNAANRDNDQNTRKIKMAHSADKLAAAENKHVEERVKMEGYLFKRTSKGFKSWVRRWFAVRNHQLVYTKRISEGWTVMEEDLRLCAVKPYNDADRRFCFEVKSPTRSHVLQAIDDSHCIQWVAALQAAVIAAYKETFRATVIETNEDHSKEVKRAESFPLIDSKKKHNSHAVLLYSVPGNDKCADCDAKEPKWASVKLGVTLCINCCGVHRNLGVHISKVRSIFLDDWEPEMLKVMVELGNDVVNSVYEYPSFCQGILRKPSSTSSEADREEYIKAKYVGKKFLRPLVPPEKSASIRRWAVAKKAKRSNAQVVVVGNHGDSLHVDDDVMMFGSSASSDVLSDLDNSIFEPLENVSTSNTLEDFHTSVEKLDVLDPNTLLFRAAEARNLSVMLEALANNADINWQNPSDNKKTTLMKAVESGSLAACEFLLLNSAAVDVVDNDNRSALLHATIKGNTAQVCQLLKRGANYKHKDNSGRDALNLAIEAEQADIVTLLRVACLRQEMTESDPGTLTDELFNDVFRDFTQMASNDPDKLKRSQLSKDS